MTEKKVDTYKVAVFNDTNLFGKNIAELAGGLIWGVYLYDSHLNIKGYNELYFAHNVPWTMPGEQEKYDFLNDVLDVAVQDTRIEKAGSFISYDTGIPMFYDIFGEEPEWFTFECARDLVTKHIGSNCKHEATKHALIETLRKKESDYTWEMKPAISTTKRDSSHSMEMIGDGLLLVTIATAKAEVEENKVTTTKST